MNRREFAAELLRKVDAGAVRYVHPGSHAIRAQLPALCAYCHALPAHPAKRGYCSESCEELHRDMRDDARREEPGS